MSYEITKMKQALTRIRNARDYHAEHGEYPQSPDGPSKDQCFDDWAADVADSVLPELDSLEDGPIDGYDY